MLNKVNYTLKVYVILLISIIKLTWVNLLYQTKGGRMENKFNLRREQNVFVAKRNIVDYIWKSANLEGIGEFIPKLKQFMMVSSTWS